MQIDLTPGWRKKLDQSDMLLKQFIEDYQPTHIISMVSGGRDSACSHRILLECGIKPDMVLHGFTRTGIEETTDWVKDTYSKENLIIADAGTAFEDYVMRKGFFGLGVDAHGYAYRILKATPFRKAISKEIRKGKRGIRVLMINGAFQSESDNRKKNLKLFRSDPAQPQNMWFNIIHHWTAEDRDAYLEANQVPINPVAKALCRSGECMCGTMQSMPERWEAGALFPKWGKWLKELETEVRNKHGYGWGERRPKPLEPLPLLDFQPACSNCLIEPEDLKS